MSLIVTGTIGIDTVITPTGHADRILGGSGTYFAAAASFFGQSVNRMWLLGMNGAHDYEHYGNIVTYLRLKGITPPSSQR